MAEYTELDQEGERHSLFFVFGLLFFVFISVAQCEYLVVMETWSFSKLFSISIVIMLISVIYLMKSSKKTFWSIYSVYGIIFCLFHYGLILVIGLGFNLSSSFNSYLATWFYSYESKYAIILVNIGFTGLVAGVSLVNLFRKKPEKVWDNSDESIPDLNNVLWKTGFFLISFSTFLWFLTVFRLGGFKLLLRTSYPVFLAVTKGSHLNWLYFCMAWGLIILAVCPPSRARRAGFLIFSIFALVGLPLGLRGEVLFPVFSALAVVSMKKIPLSPRKTFVLGICLLSAISLFKQIRHVGLGEFEPSSGQISPIGGLAELGGSIRPVVEAVSWAQAGEPFIHGSSYWAPFDRAMIYLIPGWSRPPADEDVRLMNVLIQQRVGPIGFSPIAEAYRNFGKTGVLLIMLFTGILLAWMDLWPSTQIRQLAAGFILFPLLIQVRNGFVFVPSTIVMGFVLLFFMVQISKLNSKKNKNYEYKFRQHP